MVTGAFRFLEAAPPDGVTVEVLKSGQEGGGSRVTLIRAEMRDRPFIVDTIREYLKSEQLPVEHYIYRVVGVRRDESGRIVAVGDPSTGDARSLVHCEVPRIESAERRAAIRHDLETRLGDVVEATDDFGAMLRAVDNAAAEVRSYADRFPDRREEFAEIIDFLRWLKDGNFIFLGHRAYEVVDDAGTGTQVLRVESGSGLGILRTEEDSAWAGGRPIADLPDALRKRILEGPILITSKTNAESTVHRRGRMDYIGIKKLGGEGRVIGERRFLGLFTSRAYAESAETIPILRKKLGAVLRESGATPGSHDYKEIITIFNSMPKEDLFQASTEQLNRDVHSVLELLFSDDVHVTLRPDPLERGVSVTIILPRGKFSSEVRHRVQEMLAARFEGEILNYHLAMGAGDQARLHFHVSSGFDRPLREDDADAVALEVRRLIRSWEDWLVDELEEALGGAEGRRVADVYADAFPEEYRAASPPEVAVEDIAVFERLRVAGESVALTIQEPRGRGGEEATPELSILKLYLVGERLILSDFMPILENAGLRVIEVTPYTISGADLSERMVYSFTVQDPEAGQVPPERADALAEAVLAVRAGESVTDPFNALVLRASLNWREVDVVRMYANYAFQSGLVPTRYSAARSLARYPALTRGLVDLFIARFDPDLAEEQRAARAAELRAAISSGLEKVDALTDDRTIRRIFALIEATVRTNYFRPDDQGRPRRSGGVPYISIKIRQGDVEELRRAGLLYEVFVYSARMEGIHLRGAPVSRGGIRWSDRLDDFRTEIMGLVQTQIVKNAVIVPGGSKGGFVTRRTFSDRAEHMEEGARQYRTLMRGLLDITDNIVDGRVVPPPRVVRYDGDDPYLVVAADKGTAHLSDVANAVAAEYGFWLGDAFASGGSHGYDHKKEGITARGAWECVKRHFREMGKDIQSQPFTAVGIGDMSGDVFGNGMLLSPQTQLVAAFDHRHIFIDPNPDPAAAHAERQRLFQLPRSSWDDYDRSVLSEGGMIVPRGSKEVRLTSQALTALGLPHDIGALDGERLVQAVLRAPVELLWNGGIGTYIKAEEETHAEVGDTANDPVRVNAEELRCAVIGEGGNLGLTQAARIAFALRGGRINTDALDNSGGVDMSDHEVNLKILFAPQVDSGALSPDDRNRLLEEMTDEVSALVLADNVDQSLAVSLDEIRSRQGLGDFGNFVAALERERVLDRREEGIPSVEELEDRARNGIGLTRPTLCLLLAHAKLRTKVDLLNSDLPDEPGTQSYLIDYFPSRAVEAVGIEAVREHRLRREIAAAQIANRLVNMMGSAFLERISRDTGRDRGTAAAAWFVADRISGASEIRADLQQLELTHSTATTYRWHLGLSRVVERTAHWVLLNVDASIPVATMVERLVAGLSELRGEFHRIVTGDDRKLFEARMLELKELGIDDTLASRLATLRFLPELLDILRVAHESGTPALATAEAYYAVGERLSINWLQQLLRETPSEDSWGKRLAQGFAVDAQRAHRGIANAILKCRKEAEVIDECVERYREEHETEVAVYEAVIEELRATEAPSMAAAGVAVRALAILASHQAH